MKTNTKTTSEKLEKIRLHEVVLAEATHDNMNQTMNINQLNMKHCCVPSQTHQHNTNTFSV